MAYIEAAPNLVIEAMPIATSLPSEERRLTVAPLSRALIALDTKALTIINPIIRSLTVVPGQHQEPFSTISYAEPSERNPLRTQVILRPDAQQLISNGGYVGLIQQQIIRGLIKYGLSYLNSNFKPIYDQQDEHIGELYLSPIINNKERLRQLEYILSKTRRAIENYQMAQNDPTCKPNRLAKMTQLANYWYHKTTLAINDCLDFDIPDYSQVRIEENRNDQYINRLLKRKEKKHPSKVRNVVALGLMVLSTVLSACSGEPPISHQSTNNQTHPSPLSDNRHNQIVDQGESGSRIEVDQFFGLNNEEYVLLAGITIMQEYGDKMAKDALIIHKRDLGEGWKLLVETKTTAGLHKYVYVDDSVKGKPVFYKFYEQMTRDELMQVRTGRRANRVPANPAAYISAEYQGMTASARMLYGKTQNILEQVNLVRVVRANGAIIDGVVSPDLGIGVFQLFQEGKLKPEQIASIASEAIRKSRLIAEETGIINSDLNPRNVRIITDNWGRMHVNIIDFEKVTYPKNIQDPRAYTTSLKRFYLGMFGDAAEYKKMPLDKFLRIFVESAKKNDKAFAIELAQSLWDSLPKYSQGNPLVLPENKGRLRIEFLRDIATSGARVAGKIGISGLLLWGMSESVADLTQSRDFLAADVYVGYGTQLRHTSRMAPYDVLENNDIAIIFPWGKRMDYSQLPSFNKIKGMHRAITGVVPFVNGNELLLTSLELVYQENLQGGHRVINTLTGEDITATLVPGARIPILVTSTETEQITNGQNRSSIKYANIYIMYATVLQTGDIVIQHGKINGASVPDLMARVPLEVK